MIFWTSGWRTTSAPLNVWKSMPGMSARMRRTSSRPLRLGRGRALFGVRPGEHDEGAREGAAAHVGERRDLDDAFLGEPGGVLGIEHVAQGIVERAKVGQELFAHVAG